MLARSAVSAAGSGRHQAALRAPHFQQVARRRAADLRPAAFDEGGSQKGGDEAAEAAAPATAEPTLADVMKQFKNLATKDDVAEVKTLLGSLFDTVAAAVPEDGAATFTGNFQS